MNLRRITNETRRVDSSSGSEMMKAGADDSVSRVQQFVVRKVMRRLSDERGQVMALTILCLAVLIGFVAFAIDVGMLLHAKRVMQTAADSAAIAGAAEYIAGDDYVTAARVDASQNGVTNGVNNSTVTVNGPNGPLTGPFAGTPGYVEVIVSQPQPTLLMSVFEALVKNPPMRTMTVSARAVATALASPTGLFALNPTPPGITMSNGASLGLPGAGILVNAQGSGAVSGVAGTTIDAGTLGVVGTIADGGAIDLTLIPAPVTGISFVNNPLSSSVTPPSFNLASCLPDPHIAGGSGQGFGPTTPDGIECFNGLTISTGATPNVFAPGIYVINGNLTVTGSQGGITGTGVTFYFPPGGGSYSDGGGHLVDLTAPTSGPYAGILFYQDPSNASPMNITSDATWNLNGVVYLPSGSLNLTGGISPSFLDITVVAGSLSVTGNEPFLLKPYETFSGTPPITSPRLVE
jgi:Flp pilus assembly protein TadG